MYNIHITQITTTVQSLHKIDARHLTCVIKIKTFLVGCFQKSEKFILKQIRVGIYFLMKQILGILRMVDQYFWQEMLK